MKSLKLNVPGISCSHCEMSIKNTLKEVSGVANVTVDLEKKTVSLDYDPEKASYAQIKIAIEDQGYDIE
jgi:copper chaperone